MTQTLDRVIPPAVDRTVFIAELVQSGSKLVEFSIEFANTPGAVAEVASILSKHKVNILTGFHDAKEWSFFADVTEIESSVDEIGKEISRLAIVSKVSLSEVVSEGIIVDSLHHQTSWGPFRIVTMRADVLRSILDRVKGIFGAEGPAGRAMVFGMGEAAGRSFYKGLASRLGSESVKTHIGDLVGLYEADGWGDFKMTNLDLNLMTASATAPNCIECSPEANPSASFSCDFVRGNLAGIFSEMFGRRMDVTETLCVGRGHNRCQFDVSVVKQ